jgi:integrase
MHRVIAFAILSTRRQDEITRIIWADLDKEGKRVLVRDMKTPGEKFGNDVWCDLPDPALAIIEAMPKHASQIFPYSTDAISAAFTRATQFLGIEDLRAVASHEQGRVLRHRFSQEAEPPRVCRRLQLLSKVEHHEQDNQQVFP